MWKIRMGFVFAKGVENKKYKQNFQEGYPFVNYHSESRRFEGHVVMAVKEECTDLR
jgi:hypothetical protein